MLGFFFVPNLYPCKNDSLQCYWDSLLTRLSARWGQRLTTCSKLEYPDFAKKENAVDFANKETEVDFAKKEAAVNFAMKETLIDFAKETTHDVAQKEPAVDSTKIEKEIYMEGPHNLTSTDV